MKTYKYIIMAGAALLALGACNKQEAVDTSVANEAPEFIIGIDDSFIASVETRATAINAVSGLPGTLYWGATTGSSSETVKYSNNGNAIGTQRQNASIATGRYQTNPATAYNWYVATQSFSMSATPTITIANNNTDVLAGRTAQDNTSTPGVTLKHVFCRTGSFILTASNGYTATATKWEISSPNNSITGTAGTYNMKNETWASSTARLTNYTEVTNSSDLYLIPGTYNIRVSYTLSLGEYTSPAQTATSTVTFEQGKINNVSGSVTGSGANPITINVSVTAWDTVNKTVNF